MHFPVKRLTATFQFQNRVEIRLASAKTIPGIDAKCAGRSAQQNFPLPGRNVTGPHA